MAKQARVFLLGDQSQDTTPVLYNLLQYKEDPILVTFLDRAYDTIRSELGRLPLHERKKLPRFTNLADLAAQQKERALGPSFQYALACICQLGYFMQKYGLTNRPFPRPDGSYLLGLCTGGLAAAAISSSTSLSDLLPVAVQTVAIAFRLGVLVGEFGRRIDPYTTSSWTVLFPGVRPDAAATSIKKFQESKQLPPHSRPWISAYLTNGTSVSGPPSVLDELRNHGDFAKVHPVQIPVCAPGHAAHLYNPEDVDEILKTTSQIPWANYKTHIPVVSAATGDLIASAGSNFRSTVAKCIGDILMAPMRWDLINEGLPRLLLADQNTRVDLIPIMTTTENAVRQTLESYSPQSEVSPSQASGLSWFSSVQITYLGNDQEGGTTTSQAPEGSSKLAIVGFSGRFPDAEDPAAFWEVIRQGIDTVRKIPKQRWDTDTHVNFDGKRNTGEVPWGCFIPNVDKFDARFFSISPKEAPQMDPAQRLSLMATYEAMENAGIVPGTTPSTRVDRIGCYLGTTCSDYFETNSAQDIDTFFITGGNRAFIPGRINFCFEFCGPSYSIDTACSSSLAALHLACNAIWQGDCDTAFACGTNMITNPDGHAGLDRGFFLSKTGNCKTFDAGADGYCRGEGVVTTIVKRLDDALADNDPILAVIAGTQTNHSAESDSITRPHAPTQAALFTRILNSTGTAPDELSYIEMHGTGTQVGDAVEMESVLGVFAPESTSPRARSPRAPLYLGAAKSNIGHGEAASGLTSVAKVLLMYQHNMIPPHCGIKTTINPNFPQDLGERNVHIALKETPWERSASRPRKVLINNFSAAGGNTALLLEDAPLQPDTLTGSSPIPSIHMIAVTAKCAESLKGNLRSVLKFLNDTDASSAHETFISQLSYTTTARRLHFPHRVLLRGSNIQEIKSSLENAIATSQGLTRVKAKLKITFAFTGQGSNYLGMGKQLYEAFSKFRQDINKFDQIARAQGLPSFRHIYTAQDGQYDEKDDSLSPQVIQLAITCLQMALARLWKTWGIAPGAVVGHSLGEYAALNLAGVISDADTIYLVGMRAGLLQQQSQAGTHAMLAVKASVARAKEILAENSNGDLPAFRIQVSCINGPEDTVLGGPSKQVKSWKQVLTTHGVKSTILQTPYAFHTSQVFSILGEFEALAKRVTYHKPTIPVVSSLLGAVVTEQNYNGDFNAKYLARHCRETVNMYAGLLAAQKANLINDKSCVLEIGPNPVVLGMVRATLGTSLKSLPLLQKGKDTWDLLTNAISTLYMAGHDLLWQTYFQDFKSSHKVLQLPAYSWDLKAYWMQYENDWAMHKPGLKTAEDFKTPGQGPPVKVPTVECTTIHGIVEERTESADQLSIVVETDISREDINGIAQGHTVNGIALATPSVYAEIGLSLGRYLIDRYQPGLEGSIVDVADLIVEKALIPHCNGPQMLRTSADVDWASKSAKLVFRSHNKNGKPTVEHARCSILFTDCSKLKTLKARVGEYTSRLQTLNKSAEKGTVLRLNQSYGYKLISSLASFHPDYRAIDEVILDSSTLESCSKCSFGQVKSQGKFSTHPAYIDVMTQAAGFVLNAKDTTDLDHEVYVNHGWRSLQIYEQLSPAKSYWNYVKMAQDTSSNEGFWRGDSIMFDDKNNIVAFFQDITLRRIERRIFHRVLDASNPARGKLAKQVANAPAAATTKAVPPSVSRPTMQQQTPAPNNGTVVTERVHAEAALPATAALATTVPGHPAPLPVAAVKILPKKNSKIDPALRIIAEETGLALADLTEDSEFAEIGVDSLLSMVIASRFREELDLDLDLEFSLFLDLPTVQDLRQFLEPEGNFGPAPIEAVQQSVEITVTETKSHVTHVQAAQEPTSIEIDSDKKALGELTRKLEPALAIISEESGLAIEDLTDETEFGEIGVDSLLSMVIASRFREELDLDLDLDFSLFLDLPTIGDLRDFLVPASISSSESSLSPGAMTPEENPSSSSERASSVAGESEDLNAVKPNAKRSGYCRPASSVILQGLPDQAARILFLFPDGGGSSSSYDPLPRFNESDTAIIGLNCPYARDPDNLKCGIDDLMDSYLTELRRRQPHGPYHIGGWSSGGIFSFLAAHRLTAAGEDVSSLLIIDSPVPRTIHRLPAKFYEYCDTLGLFGYSMGPSKTPQDQGRSKAPDWLFAHFKASIEVMQDADFPPLSASTKMPQVSIIWAGDAVLKAQDLHRLPEVTGLAPGQSAGQHFLLEPRKDFGPGGWEDMFPGANITTETVHRANHFSMMQKPYIDQVGRFLERGLRRG